MSESMNYFLFHSATCTEKSDWVSMASISVETINPDPSKVNLYPGDGLSSQSSATTSDPSQPSNKQRVAWKETRGPQRGTKEGDRWRAVEASYVGRYTSKVTPLQTTDFAKVIPNPGIHVTLQSLSSNLPSQPNHNKNVALKGAKRPKRESKEGERWKAVHASYTGRYTSKVTPLLTTEEILDRENRQHPLYRPNSQ